MTRALHLNPQIAAKVLLSKEAQQGNSKVRNEDNMAKTERRIDFMDVKKSLITHPDDAVRGS